MAEGRSEVEKYIGTLQRHEVRDERDRAIEMRVASLTVFDETASITLMLPEFPGVPLDNLMTGSVLVIENGAVILNP